MKKILSLVTNDCALAYEDIIVVMKNSTNYFDQATQSMKKDYLVQIMLDKQVTPITIQCETEKEMNELFNKLIKERNR